jgi:hypothetical protein
MKNHSAMHNTSDFRHANQFIGNEVFYRLVVCNIARPYHNIYSTKGKLLNQLLDFARYRSASRYKNNVLSSFRNHPPCHTSPKTTSASNQDVCGIRTKEFVPFARRRCLGVLLVLSYLRK